MKMSMKENEIRSFIFFHGPGFNFHVNTIVYVKKSVQHVEAEESL